mmetsp:Transcript_118/g.255  ORF Transcript_118/g.255 Transcript_118/m.255 type:complete len:261 (+) Transcript_118:304-1086(+)
MGQISLCRLYQRGWPTYLLRKTLGRPLCNICMLLWGRWISLPFQSPIEGIYPTESCILPHHLIDIRVVVDEGMFEPVPTQAPVQAHSLHQARGRHKTYATRHPSLHPELAHSRVDEGRPRPPGLPGAFGIFQRVAVKGGSGLRSTASVEEGKHGISATKRSQNAPAGFGPVAPQKVPSSNAEVGGAAGGEQSPSQIGGEHRVGWRLAALADRFGVVFFYIIVFPVPHAGRLGSLQCLMFGNGTPSFEQVPGPTTCQCWFR